MNSSLLDCLRLFMGNNPLFLFHIPLLMLGSFIYGIILTNICKNEEFFDKRYDYIISSILLLLLSFGFMFSVLSACSKP